MNGLSAEIRTTFIVAILVLLLFIAFIIFFILYYKKRQLQVQIEQNLIRTEFENQLLQKELENVKNLYNERHRISMDIHDDLGSEINGIRLKLENLQGTSPSVIISKDELTCTIDQLTNISSTMKDLIWSLEFSNDSLENFIAYIRNYTATFFEKHHIQLHFEIPEIEEDMRIDGTLRRNILLSIKEALNNIYKHSQASKVWLKIGLTAKIFYIEIRDNGIGLSQKNNCGNGLNNMKARIENSKGEYKLESNIDEKGVLIQMNFSIDNLQRIVES